MQESGTAPVYGTVGAFRCRINRDQRKGAVMAQSVKIILEDNLEGHPADGTLQFGLNGRQYEIHLSTANAEKLQALRRFRPAGPIPPPVVTRRRRSSGHGQIRSVTRSPSTAASTRPSRTPTPPPSRRPLPHVDTPSGLVARSAAAKLCAGGDCCDIAGTPGGQRSSTGTVTAAMLPPDINAATPGAHPRRGSHE